MRNGLKADERLPFDTLFFENSFAHGLIPEYAGQFRDALAHFVLTRKESGSSGNFAVDDPGFATDNSVEYIVTYEVKH